MHKDKHEDQLELLRMVYRDSILEHGATAKGVGWSDETSQVERFKVLTQGISLGRKFILDVGCGYGRLAFHLMWHHSYPLPNYTGIDIMPELVLEAQKRYGRFGTFHPFDAKYWADEMGENAYDVVLGSGVVAMWHEPIPLLIDMWHMAKECMAFNWNTNTSNLTVDRVLALCREVGCKRWNINHNYLPDDYTVHMFKDNTGKVESEDGAEKELVSV